MCIVSIKKIVFGFSVLVVFSSRRFTLEMCKFLFALMNLFFFLEVLLILAGIIPDGNIYRRHVILMYGYNDQKITNRCSVMSLITRLTYNVANIRSVNLWNTSS